VAGFALNRGADGSVLGDGLMVVAVVLCGLAYAEGAVSRRLGGWQAISWALVVCSPVAALLGALTWPGTFSGLPMMAWGGLVYVSVFTMLLGFIFGIADLHWAASPGSGSCSFCSPLWASASRRSSCARQWRLQ
jgi:drug/metabolite transporter (DMT)-like permease